LSLYNVGEKLRAIDRRSDWGRRKEEIEVKDAENMWLLHIIAIVLPCKLSQMLF
jgi:hypothetical protein